MLKCQNIQRPTIMISFTESFSDLFKHRDNQTCTKAGRYFIVGSTICGGLILFKMANPLVAAGIGFSLSVAGYKYLSHKSIKQINKPDRSLEIKEYFFNYPEDFLESSEQEPKEKEKDARDYNVQIGLPRRLDLDKAHAKMLKNARKAIKELRTNLKNLAFHGPDDGDIYSNTPWIGSTKFIVDPSIIPSKVSDFPNSTPLSFSFSSDAQQGLRKHMEDFHFFVEHPEGILTGVFDGHSGQAVASFAAERFKRGFFHELKSASGNVHTAFEVLNHKIQLKIISKKLDGGSTAIICYVNKMNQIFTATIGDSEARLYRRVDGRMMSIPLSCIRNWGSKKDAARAAKALNSPRIANEWPKNHWPKLLRYKKVINVSRSLGDLSYSGTVERPGIIYKMKITMNYVKPGDVLISGSDGFWDYMPDKHIIKQMIFPDEEIPLAMRLVKAALGKYRSLDNVTAVTIGINAANPERPQQ